MNASSDRLLRRTLWGNAVFSVVSGAVLVAFAAPFAAWATHAPLSVAGLDLAIVFELLGMGVVLFGAICGWVASRETLPQGWARVIFAADIAWVAASALVLALPAPWTMEQTPRVTRYAEARYRYPLNGNRPPDRPGVGPQLQPV